MSICSRLLEQLSSRVDKDFWVLDRLDIDKNNLRAGAFVFDVRKESIWCLDLDLLVVSRHIVSLLRVSISISGDSFARSKGRLRRLSRGSRPGPWPRSQVLLLLLLKTGK